MNELPRTIAELKTWLASRDVDAKKFAVDAEPVLDGYFVREVPGYWTINVYGWPAESVYVRCDTEAQLCECYVELVTGTDSKATSLTRRLRKEIDDRIKRSWQDPIA